MEIIFYLFLILLTLFIGIGIGVVAPIFIKKYIDSSLNEIKKINEQVNDNNNTRSLTQEIIDEWQNGEGGING